LDSFRHPLQERGGKKSAAILAQSATRTNRNGLRIAERKGRR